LNSHQQQNPSAGALSGRCGAVEYLGKIANEPRACPEKVEQLF
jgi:hypothetical protein